AKDGLVRLYQTDGKKHVLDYTLDQLETLLDPQQFFRINRQLIIAIEAIRNIHLYFNSRLKLDLHPPLEEEAVVSRDRVPSFKAWLDR
ncbi:MAG: LytTR family transcriptional regulator DNA-binding domain-containing protein, partial [Phaeodactylibacter sp.]|nr:LytTR family transcriptional regulator DNA-binding domain-containing protein [Phaeodactylibacter sp.]